MPAAPTDAVSPRPTRGVLCCLTGLLLAAGCGYGEISPKSYQLSQALYSVCNQQDEARLAVVEKLIDAARTDGEITARESSWLGEIIDQARNSNWNDAANEARSMMEDQVR